MWLKTGTPLRWEYLPVRIAARLRVQIELVTKQFSNFIPSFANRSMFGVLLMWLPYALMACAAWSSDIMKTMLGGLIWEEPARFCRASVGNTETDNSNAARNKQRMII